MSRFYYHRPLSALIIYLVIVAAITAVIMTPLLLQQRNLEIEFAKRDAEYETRRVVNEAYEQAREAESKLRLAQNNIDIWKDYESAYGREQYQEALAEMKEVKSRYNKKSLEKLDEILAVTKATAEIIKAIDKSNISVPDAKVAASISPKDLKLLIQRSTNLVNELLNSDNKIDNIQAILSNAKAQ